MNKLFHYINKNLFSFIILLGSLIFYIFFAFYDGAHIYLDSQSYIDMSFSREPFYPLFLAAFRLVDFENYLQYAVIFQSILMAFCGWLLADYLRRKIELPKFYGILLYLLPIGTSLLCRFAAQRASMYSNSVLTEGICIPLYLFFVYCILCYLWDDSKVHIILGWFVGFLMISSRKQMLMVLPLFFLAVVYHNLNKQNFRKGILIAALSCLAIFPAFKLFDCTYNYFTRGIFQGHSSSNRFVTTMVFYNAERSDAEYLKDQSTKQLFLNIYDTCEQMGYLGSQAGEGWYHEADHFGDHYDHIQINTMWPMILQHARDTINSSPEYSTLSEAELTPLYDTETDRLNSTIISSVLPHQIPKLTKCLFNNFLSGLVTTIAQVRTILLPYTMVMYLAYLSLTGRLIWVCNKNKNNSSKLLDATKMTVIFSLVTLLGIFFNVLLVSSVIFCQTRYTIYNMPLFYMAGAILLYQNALTLKKHK